MIFMIVCMILFRVMDGKVLDVCKDCKTAEEGSYLCWKFGSTDAELTGTCKVRRLETRENLLLRSMDLKAGTVILRRTSMKCRDIQADYAILQGRICERTQPILSTLSTTTTTSNPFPWPFKPEEGDEQIQTNSTTRTTTSTTTATRGTTSTTTTSTIRPMQISFRASMTTQYWLLTISLVVVGSVGVGLLFRCLRRRRLVNADNRPRTIEIEEIGPMEAAPLSPRRRKSGRGSRSQSFESIELFSVDKRD